MLTGRELIQRMGTKPSRPQRAIGSWIGLGLVGRIVGRTSYDLAARALDSYQVALRAAPPVAENEAERARQMDGLDKLLEQVAAHANGYLEGDHSAAHKAVMADLLQAVSNEKQRLCGVLYDPAVAGTATRYTWNQRMEFGRHGVPISPYTDLGDFHDDNVVSDKVFGSGAMNTVHEVVYQPTSGGEPVTRIVKPLQAEYSVQPLGAALAGGIPNKNPHYGARNLLMSHADQRLGWSVIPRTTYAMHKGELAIAMEKAPGQTAHRLGAFLRESEDDEDYREGESDGQREQLLGNPSFQIQTTRLQVLDFWKGQMDRHANNYLIDVQGSYATGRVTVSGIDNDMSHGERFTDPKQPVEFTRRGAEPVLTGFNVGAPAVLLEEDAAAIEGIHRDWDAYARDVEHLATPAMLDADKQRLDHLVGHIRDARANGRIVPGDATHTPEERWAAWRQVRAGRPEWEVVPRTALEVMANAAPHVSRAGVSPPSYALRDFGR